MAEQDYPQATVPGPGASGRHPVMEGVTEAAGLVDAAAGFLSPTREYDEPGFTGWPRDLDGRETLAMVRQLAGIVDAVSGCLAGITCQHAIAAAAKPALDETVTLLSATARKLDVLSGTPGREPGTAASPVRQAEQNFPHGPVTRLPADPARDAAPRTAIPPAARHRNTP